MKAHFNQLNLGPALPDTQVLSQLKPHNQGTWMGWLPF